MSYPYGPVVSPILPDLPYTILQRRQGDVKSTLIPITLNGAPVNIAGWTFIFSVTLATGVQEVIWTVQAPTSSPPITTVDGTGFAIPDYNATVSAEFISTAQFTAGNQIFITGAGIYQIKSVTNSTLAVILNMGLAGNLNFGNVPSGSNVYELGQVGMTVLVIPSSITTATVGLYPMYLKYETADPAPGPYKSTFLKGSLQILSQNDPNA